jgi:transcriptional regulator with XRE-family HTH domain
MAWTEGIIMQTIFDFTRPPNQLRLYRKKRRLRIRDILTLLALSSPSQIAHWEKGRKMPTLENALKLSAAIGCPVEVLFIERFQQLRKEVSERRIKFDITTFFNQ